MTEAVERGLPTGSASALIGEALRRAAVSAVPETAEALVFFVSGALRDVAEETHDELVADALMAELGPVLDRAWELERLTLTDAIAPSGRYASAITRRHSGVLRSADHDAAEGDEDTVPAPADPQARTEVDDLDLRLGEPPRISISDKPPSSRLTVPYLAAALAPGGAATSIVVADRDEASRNRIAEELRRCGALVATAESRWDTRKLIRLLHPSVLVADIDTIAPDFEPLGPTFEELLHEVPEPAVILIGTSAPREPGAQVVGSLLKPIDPSQLLRLVEASLAPASTPG